MSPTSLPAVPTRAMTARRITIAVTGAALAYAVLRYVALGTVPAAQLPVFILNKAFAVGALALVAIALAIGPLVRLGVGRPRWMTLRQPIGVHGFVLGAVHAVLSLANLSPVAYKKLYAAAGTLTFEGGLALLGGVLAAAALIVPAITSAALVRRSMSAAAWQRTQRLGLVALGLGLFHVAALGWRTWFAPETWPGGLPPLTLVAVAVAGLAFAIRGVERAVASARRARSPATAVTNPR